MGWGWAEGWSRLYLLLEPAGALNMFHIAPVPSAQNSVCSLRVAFWATHVVQWLCLLGWVGTLGLSPALKEKRRVPVNHTYWSWLLDREVLETLGKTFFSFFSFFSYFFHPSIFWCSSQIPLEHRVSVVLFGVLVCLCCLLVLPSGLPWGCRAEGLWLFPSGYWAFKALCRKQSPYLAMACDPWWWCQYGGLPLTLSP